MHKARREDPYPCGRERKARPCRRCAGCFAAQGIVKLAPRDLVRFANRHLRDVEDDGVEDLVEEALGVVMDDCSLRVEVPNTFSVGTKSAHAIWTVSRRGAVELFDQLVSQIETPFVRFRLARKFVELSKGGRIDEKVAAAAITDLCANEASCIVFAAVAESLGLEWALRRTPMGVAVTLEPYGGGRGAFVPRTP